MSKDLHQFPHVVAAITTYRSQEYVGSAIKSLVAQDYPNMRCLVIDDYSPDGTVEAARTSAATAARPVEVLTNESNLGFSTSLNRALDLCADDDLLFIHQDDVELSTSDYVRRLVAHFRDRRVAVVSGQTFDFGALPLMQRIFARLLNLDYTLIGVSEISYSLLKADLFQAGSVKRAGKFGYVLNQKLGLEDQYIAHRLRALGFRILKDPSAQYRVKFARAETLRRFLAKEYDGARILGFAVATGMITAIPPSKETHVKFLQRLIKAITVMVLVTGGIVALTAPAMGLALIGLVVAVRAIWYVVMGSGFSRYEKVYLIAVGILHDIWSGLGAYAGFLRGLKARWIPQA